VDIVLIRHGESEADILHVHEGAADFPLTELGRKQANEMAKVVHAKFKPDAIWASTLKRASETADILSSVTGVEVKKDDALREYNNGVLAGLSFEEADRLYPEPVGGRKPHERILHGESSLEFRLRAEMVFLKILTEAEGLDRIAIVSHGGMISNLLKAFLNIPLHANYGFYTGDTGMHLLRMTEQGRAIVFLNQDHHTLNILP
jgi:2,3-bisphosphoglycerate-dependent phosphoglycerate mutase